MASPSDFAARGKLLRVQDGTIVFAPVGTTYELHLIPAGGSTLSPADLSLGGLIRAQARKIWTVPSGGNFVVPIFGSPRVIQGRIRYLDETQMVVQAGVPVIVRFPADPRAFDLANGPLAVGELVNATLLPQATFELAPAPAVV